MQLIVLRNYTGVVAFTGASEINETNGVLPIWFNDCIDGLAIEKIIIKDASGNTFNDYTININGNRGFEIVFNGTPDEGTYTVVFDESLQGILHSNIIENIGFSISVGESNSLTVEEKEVPKSPRINGFVLKDKEGTELNYEFEIDAENVDKAVILMNTEVAASSLQLVNLYVKTYKGWENVPVNITQTGTDIEIDLNGILNSGRQYKLRAKGGFAAAEDNAFISEIDISWNINTQKVDDSFSASFSDMAYGQIPASVEKMYSTNVTTVADSGDEHGMALFSGQGTSHTNIKLENVITEGTAHFGFDLKAKDLVWSALYILNGSNDNTIGFGNFTRSSGISFNTDFGGSVMNENTGWKTDEWNEIDIVVQMSDTNNVDMYFFCKRKAFEHQNIR